jgi:hypothetical protein
VGRQCTVGTCVCSYTLKKTQEVVVVYFDYPVDYPYKPPKVKLQLPPRIPHGHPIIVHPFGGEQQTNLSCLVPGQWSPAFTTQKSTLDFGYWIDLV